MMSDMVVRSSALVVVAAIAVAGCNQGRATGATAEESWLVDAHGHDTEKRFALVARHLRGLDVAMVEVGHRYGELYWAGRDANWEYASYQIDKIELAIAKAVERRPKRAASARMIAPPLTDVRDAVARRSPETFDAAFTTLTQMCNACHLAERVGFIRVVSPTQRLSPVHGAALAAPGEPPAAPSPP